MRTFTALGVLTGCHLAATIALLALTYSSGMARFDSGEPAGPIECGASAVLSILSFPVLTRLVRGRGAVPWYFDGVLGYIPFVLNSLLWAGAILGCVWLIRKGVRHRAARGVTRSTLNIL